MIPGARNPYRDVTEFMNKSGLRGPDFSPRKPPGVVRIVCLGDSTTYGFTLREESYPDLLRARLNRHQPPRYEVINAGMPGTNLYQQRLFFESAFSGAGVDVLIVMSGPNNRAELKQFRDKMKRPIFRGLRAVERFAARFAVFRALRHLIKGGVNPEIRDDPVVVPRNFFSFQEYAKDYWDDLHELERLSRQWGFRLAFIAPIERRYLEFWRRRGLNPDDPGYPAAMRSLYPDVYLTSFAEHWGAPLIDIAQDFLRYDQAAPGLWNDPSHPGPLGNQLIAERVVRELTAAGILSGNRAIHSSGNL
jgi:lysophospholipase L1-like esterase